jgi:NAD(P)-dependent dehydrogenase (short-subunit alcohol dehydrogenase family)
MDLQLTHKHILITGGSKGIGLACAQGFLREGARVSLIGRNSDTLAAALRTLAAEFADAPARVGTFSADLQDAAQAQRALDEACALHGPVDVLVNSAGAARRTPPDELTPQAWRDAMDAKYFSYTNMIDPVIRQMGLSGSGAIVNVVGAGGKTPSPIHLPGGAANAALMLISAGLASAYAARGVRVNAINPGATLTDRLTEGLQAQARLDNITVDEALARVTRRVPMGRLADPSEVADTVIYLSSARASYVTGVTMTMDGASAPMVV